MNLSKKSIDFLENLRVYLFSSRKNEKEIEGIIREVEDRLYEAEKNGENVDDIIRKASKEYMAQLTNEMSSDFEGLIKFIPIMILGAMSYILMGDAIRGEIEYSLLDLIGYPFIFLFSLFLTVALFKYATSNKIPKIKEWLIVGILGITPMILSLLLFYLNSYYELSVIQVGVVGNVIAIVVSSLVFIGIAIWSKTWVTIILPIILFLPEILINMTNLQESTKLILNSIFIPLCVASFSVIYVLILWKMEKNKTR
ncbi:HAAS domain-containing protein [Aneurinibacillus aneurinilyticus]|uniref:HAAS domain-containing protein n=1 Tax=Aneurinibacillus aneurinilyticus TaxID=1391 RepID=UPI00366D7A27